MRTEIRIVVMDKGEMYTRAFQAEWFTRLMPTEMKVVIDAEIQLAKENLEAVIAKSNHESPNA